MNILDAYIHTIQLLYGLFNLKKNLNHMNFVLFMKQNQTKEKKKDLNLSLF